MRGSFRWSKHLTYITFFCMVIIFAATMTAFADSKIPSICINDYYVTYDGESGFPFIDSSNRTQVPLRATMEFYGCSVDWDQSSKCITVSQGKKNVKLWIGSDYMSITNNGKVELTTIDTHPVLIRNRTFLPIRAVLEAFGAEVDYIKDTRTITAKSPAYLLDNKDEGTKDVRYEWTDSYNTWEPKTWTYTAKLSNARYNYYKGLERKTYYGRTDYASYAQDPMDDGEIAELIKAFREGAAEYDKNQLARLVVAFVQSFEYVSDEDWTGTYDEYPKYPYETLYDHCGDCEDTAILLVTLLREMGYDACLMLLPGHMAVGILGGDSVNGAYKLYGNKKYFYIETTATEYRIGDIPRNYRVEDIELLFI